MKVLGIDIGGSGIKGALVDTVKGEMISERLRIPTPQPADPDGMIEAIAQIVQHFEYQGALGAGFPGVLVNGVTQTAANLDKGWVNFPAAEAIAKATGCQATILNDADAAGIAEMAHGAGKGENGVVMIFTLGTGIGSCMFVNGRIVPNLELGHIYLPGHTQDAEDYAASSVRKAQGLSWKAWGQRLNEYFQYIEFLFSPQLIIIGGGVSKKYEKFFPYINIKAKIVPAKLRNQAGIIGAAIAAK